MSKAITVNSIESKIYLIRGQKVMLDRDLAELYDVEVRALIQAVKRNILRFPQDFTFQLNEKETDSLRSQTVILKNSGRGKHSKYLPYVFTEQGIAMLSSVLKSERAIVVNVQIMRTFVKLRELMQTHKDLWQKIQAMESQYDHQFKAVFEAIRQIMIQEEKPKRRMGFHAD